MGMVLDLGPEFLPGVRMLLRRVIVIVARSIMYFYLAGWKMGIPIGS